MTHRETLALNAYPKDLPDKASPWHPLAAPFPGWPTAKMEGIMTALQEDLAKLVPNAHYAIATKSGHNIHQDQPELVIATIREVVEAVRNPSTWTPAP